MKNFIRIAVALVVIVVIALVVVWFKLDTIVQHAVETVGPYLTKTEVKLDKVHLSPFSGSGTLNGLFVGNPEGYKTPSAIQMGKMAVKVDVGSLKSDKIIVDSVDIESPEITLEGGLKENNLTKILDNLEAASGASEKSTGEEPEQAQKKASRKIQVNDLVVRNAKVNLSLSMLGGASAPITIPDIHLTNIGTGGDGTTVADLSKQVFEQILQEVLPAATEAVSKLGKDLLMNKSADATQKAADSVEKATKGIGDLFKKN